MIVKKESVCKKTGEKKVSYETTNPKMKVSFREGQPIEVPLTQEEKQNRTYGKDSQGHGQSSGRQNNLSKRSATELSKQGRNQETYDSDAKVVHKLSPKKESAQTNVVLSKKAKKVDDLSMKLKKAKLDYNTALLDKKIRDFEEKEKFYMRASKVLSNSKKELKQKHTFFVDQQTTPSDEIEADIVDKIQQIAGEPQQEEHGCEDGPLSEKNDLLKRLGYVLREAPEDEEEEEDPLDLDSKEDAPEGEEDGSEEEEVEPEEEPGEDEGMPVEKNEIEMITGVNNFNVDENNVYEYYDFIIDKLNDPTSKKALNAEYADIKPNRRKVTPARELYDRAIKRLELLNDTEKQNLDQELGATEGGEEEEDEELDI